MFLINEYSRNLVRASQEESYSSCLRKGGKKKKGLHENGKKMENSNLSLVIRPIPTDCIITVVQNALNLRSSA